MRKFIILVLLTTTSLSSSANDLLRKAEKAYDSKNYAEAVRDYEKLITEGFRSYQLYFNLGNSYYRNNELGKAIYYYELARKMEPNVFALIIENSMPLQQLTLTPFHESTILLIPLKGVLGLPLWI